MRGGRDCSGYFDIQLDFAVGAARIVRGRVRAAINGDSGDFWRCDAEIFEKGIEICGVIAAAQFDHSDALPSASGA